MSDSNRSRYFAVGLVAAIILLLALAVGYSKESEQDDYSRDAAAANEGKPIDQFGTPRAGVPAIAEAFVSNPEPQQSNEREQRDLAAQEGMAVWAFWMAVFAGLTAVVTFVGTILIWRQVSLTREAVKDTGDATIAMVDANEIARETANAQLRAYVGTPGGILAHSNSANPRVVIDIRNFGQTPASIVAQDFRVVHFAYQPNGPTRRIFFQCPIEQAGHCDPGHSQSRTAVIQGPINFLQSDQVYAELTITYTTQGGDTYWRRMSYQVTRDSMADAKNRIRMDVHETEQEDGKGLPPPSNLNEN